MMTLDEIQLAPLALDLLLAAGLLFVFLADLILGPRQGKSLGYLSAFILLTILVASFWLDTHGLAFGGAYIGGPWPLFFKRVFLAAGVLVCLGSADHIAARQPNRQGEYYLLLLSSLLGMMLLPGARDLLLLFVCFELMGIPLYVLAAYPKTDDPSGRERGAVEGAMKLYLIGAASTAITLFGLSWVVGLAGTTAIAGIAALPSSPLLALGMAMIIAGMGFKIGVAPFHMWVPDTYEGGSTPFIAFLSVAPKAAGLAALFTLLHVGFADQAFRWMPILIGLAALTIVMGNLLALPQTKIKRLLAYSGVAQIGYLLMGFATGDRFGAAMVLFYLVAYLFTNVGAMLVVQAAAEGGQGEDRIEDLAGLHRRSPWLALAMLLFLLSLAGIPFVAGFWAKVYVFMAAWKAGLVWLVVLGALFAVVALFYYLQVARAMYMREPERAAPLRPPPALALAILICLLAILAIGLHPAPILEEARAASALLYL